MRQPLREPVIIDSHVHLPVVCEKQSYERAMQVLLSDMDRDHVDYAVLIPDNCPSSPIGDVETCLKLAEGESRVFVVGTIDVERQGSDWIAQLDTYLAAGRIVGMKVFPGHDPIYPTDARLLPVYELCQEHQVPMIIHTGRNPGHPEAAKYNDPKYIVQIAEAYPGLRIVIAHYFWPEVDYCYELTHCYPAIFFDTSGLADEEVVTATGADRIRGVLLRTLADSPERVVFGTDYAACDRQAHIELVNSLPIPSEVRENVFWRNAARLFRLDRVARLLD